MELYKRLQYVRKIRGLTQKETADHFYISRQAVQKWESGETSPDISKLHDLSVLYNISLDLLLDYNLTEESFKKKVHNSDVKNNKNAKAIIHTLNNPGKTDRIIMSIVLFSILFLILITLPIALMLSLVLLGILGALLISSVYFIVNGFYSIGLGFDAFIVNVGISLLSLGIFIIINQTLMDWITWFNQGARTIISRLKTYITLIRGVKDEE